jgi:dihydrofolate synthase/folylpolyglutamate synthase
MKQVAHTPHDKLHVVLGMVGDKDVSGILALLPSHAEYYFCHADMPRALPAADLQQKAAAFSLKGMHYESVQAALAQAQQNAAENDLVYIGGSTFVVAEAL